MLFSSPHSLCLLLLPNILYSLPSYGYYYLVPSLSRHGAVLNSLISFSVFCLFHNIFPFYYCIVSARISLFKFSSRHLVYLSFLHFITFFIRAFISLIGHLSFFTVFFSSLPFSSFLFLSFCLSVFPSSVPLALRTLNTPV